MQDVAIESISWVRVDGRESLQIDFHGVLTNQEALRLSAEWKAQFAARGGQKFNVIFNCLAMKDYEPMARFTWQKTIGDLKNQIGGICVVTENRLIAAGAGIIGLFTSFKIRTVNTLTKIEF